MRTDPEWGRKFGIKASQKRAAACLTRDLLSVFASVALLLAPGCASAKPARPTGTGSSLVSGNGASPPSLDSMHSATQGYAPPDKDSLTSKDDAAHHRSMGMPPPMANSSAADRPLSDSTERWTRIEQSSIREIDSLLKEIPSGDLQMRLDWVGRQWIGRPYLRGPMGEGGAGGPEPKPRARTDVFDCVTYIEQVEAVARTKDVREYLRQLDAIRYLDGLPTYARRNHWFEFDWLVNNGQRVRVRHFAQDTTETRVLTRKAFFAEKGIASRDTAFTFRYLPRTAALTLLDNWHSDRRRIAGVAIVGTLPFLFITHTGFLIEERDAPPRFRHASTKGQVMEQDFRSYLQGRTSAAGIVVWDYLE